MVLALYTDPAFLDPDTCRRVRAAMDAGAADDAEVLDAGIERRTDVRRAATIEIDPALLAAVEARFEATRETLEAFFGVPLAAREGAGFLRYPDGGFYQPHRDRATVPSWPAAARRRIALVLFLNGAEDFDGGLLRVDCGGRTIDVQPAPGLLAAFPADLVHEVTVVRGGPRDAVVDWFYEPIG